MARFRDQNTYSGCPTGLEPRRGREGLELKLKEAPTLRVLRVQGRCLRARASFSFAVQLSAFAV